MLLYDCLPINKEQNTKEQITDQRTEYCFEEYNKTMEDLR